MPGVDKHTTHYESCGCAEAKVERLEEKNKGLRKDNLELVNSLEGEGYRLERLEARVRELEAALRGILRYKSHEVCKDEFAYDRMVAAYRKAARVALKGDADDEG